MEKTWLVVGLGNPGTAYAKTRHNIGFKVVEQLAERHEVRLKKQRKLLGRVGKGRIEGQEVILLLPETYMNESGRSVRLASDYYKLGASELLVVVDDTTLPFGKLRLRSKGSAGGHNGLKSIAAHLGTEQYARLRVGIGASDQQDLADYVLAGFSKAEKAVLSDVVNAAAFVIESCLHEPLDEVINRMSASTGPAK